MTDGTRASDLARLLDVGVGTLQQWRSQFAGENDGVNCLKDSHRHVTNRLSEEKRQRILLTCNVLEIAALRAGKNMPILADLGLSLGSERSFYRVLHTHGKSHRTRSGTAITGAQNSSTATLRRTE